MSLISLLVNLLILLLIMTVIYVIVEKILQKLGYSQFSGIALAVVLLIGLVWFLAMIGVISGGRPIIVM